MTNGTAIATHGVSGWGYRGDIAQTLDSSVRWNDDRAGTCGCVDHNDLHTGAEQVGNLGRQSIRSVMDGPGANRSGIVLELIQRAQRYEAVHAGRADAAQSQLDDEVLCTIYVAASPSIPVHDAGWRWLQSGFLPANAGR